jgi:hypothetical protein
MLMLSARRWTDTSWRKTGLHGKLSLVKVPRFLVRGELLRDWEEFKGIWEELLGRIIFWEDLMGLGIKRGRIFTYKGKIHSVKGKNYWGESFFWEDLTGLA